MNSIRLKFGKQRLLFCMPALCGNGAMKLLQDGEALLQMMVLCMGRSRSYSVQMEGFRLAQRLAVIIATCSFTRCLIETL